MKLKLLKPLEILNGIETDATAKQTGTKESRKRKVSDRKSDSEKIQHSERTKSYRPHKMWDGRYKDACYNGTSSLPVPAQADDELQRIRTEQQIERQKKTQEQIAKNKKRNGFLDFYIMATQ